MRVRKRKIDRARNQVRGKVKHARFVEIYVILRILELAGLADRGKETGRGPPRPRARLVCSPRRALHARKMFMFMRSFVRSLAIIVAKILFAGLEYVWWAISAQEGRRAV